MASRKTSDSGSIDTDSDSSSSSSRPVHKQRDDIWLPPRNAELVDDASSSDTSCGDEENKVTHEDAHRVKAGAWVLKPLLMSL